MQLPSHGSDSPRLLSTLNPVERALLPARVLTEKLRAFAAELQDEELQQSVGPPLMSREALGLPSLRQVSASST